MKNFFEAMLFEHEDKLYEGERIDLRQRYSVSEKEAFDGVATVYYDIYLHGRGKIIGSIDLRLTMNEDMYYYGHVGYEIIKKFRGHHYAYDACELLFKIAKEEYKMDELFITCDPENVASYKNWEVSFWRLWRFLTTMSFMARVSVLSVYFAIKLIYEA